MNIAALLALLLGSGACAKSEFGAPDGTTVSVIVCPLIGSAGEQATPPPPPPPVPQRQT